MLRDMAKTASKKSTPRPSVEVQADLDYVNAEIDALKSDARALAGELNGSLAYEAAAASLADMDDTQRAALAQAITTVPIESSAAVGDPGN